MARTTKATPFTITSPLSLGDAVYVIVDRDATVFTPCEECAGVGTFPVMTARGAALGLPCPVCKGAGKNKTGARITVFEAKLMTVVGVDASLKSETLSRGLPPAFRFQVEQGAIRVTVGALGTVDMILDRHRYIGSYFLDKAMADTVVKRWTAAAAAKAT